MQVACPQCGAPVTAQTETRFYRCAYCSSAFVIQGGEGVEQFTISHQRDDRQAWSALADHLESHRVKAAFQKGPVEFLIFPFWCLALDTGATRLVPAVSSSLPELSRMSLPGGDLRFPDPDEELTLPVTPLSDAEQTISGGTVTRRSLVHLPLYHLSYTVQGTPFQAVVSGVDRKVYVRNLPAEEGVTIRRHHILLICVYAVFLMVEGVAIRHLGWRALAFGLSGLAAWFLMYALLRREC